MMMEGKAGGDFSLSEIANFRFKLKLAISDNEKSVLHFEVQIIKRNLLNILVRNKHHYKSD